MTQNDDRARQQNEDFTVPEPARKPSSVRALISSNRFVAIGTSVATLLLGAIIVRSTNSSPETSYDRSRHYISQYDKYTHPVEFALSRAVSDKDMEAAQILAEQYVREGLPIFGNGPDLKTSIEAWAEAVTGWQETGGVDDNRASEQIDMIKIMLGWAQKYQNVDVARLAGRFADDLGASGDSEATHALRLNVLDVETSLGEPRALMTKAEINAAYSTNPDTYGSEQYARAALIDASEARRAGLQGGIESYARVLTTLALSEPHNRRLVNTAVAAWTDFDRWVAENDNGKPGYQPALENRDGTLSWDTKTADMLTASKQGDLYLAAGDFETAANLSRPHTLKFVEPSDDFADFQDAVLQNYAEALLSQAVLPNANGTSLVDQRKIQQAQQAVVGYNKLVQNFYEPQGYDNWKGLNDDLLEDINRFEQEVRTAIREGSRVPTWEEVESETAYGSSLCLPNGAPASSTRNGPTLATC